MTRPSGQALQTTISRSHSEQCDVDEIITDLVVISCYRFSPISYNITAIYYTVNNVTYVGPLLRKGGQ